MLVAWGKKRSKWTHTNLGWGRKLLTLDMLHMPSRYCWAWMVTVLRDPVSCPSATVTWTLVFGPVLAAFWDQLGTPWRPPTGRTEWGEGWLFESCFVWMLEDDTVNLEGCGIKDVLGKAAMLELKARTGAWSVCKASCLSWWRGVEQTWQHPGSWFPGVWSCSNRKVAYPGSCREKQEMSFSSKHNIQNWNTLKETCFFQSITTLQFSVYIYFLLSQWSASSPWLPSETLTKLLPTPSLGWFFVLWVASVQRAKVEVCFQYHLFVSLSARLGLHKCYQAEFPETWWRGTAWGKEEPIKLCCLSKSPLKLQDKASTFGGWLHPLRGHSSFDAQPACNLKLLIPPK